MSERTKKILFAVFFVSFSIGMGYLLFTLFFRARAPQVVVTTPEEQVAGQLKPAGAGTPQGTTPTAAPGAFPEAEVVPETAVPEQLPPTESRVLLLQDTVTQAVTPSSDGNGARFYNPEDGRFYKVNPDGSITLLGDKQFFNVEQVDWGNQKDHAILEFPDDTKVYYDFEQQKQVVLPKHWSEFEFAQNDQKVAAKSMGIDPENRFLITSKPDGTEARAIEALGENADLAHISWSPSGQIVGYAFTGEAQSGDLQQEVLFVGQNHENFKSIIAPGADFLPNWSLSGKQILFSTWSPASSGKPNLWVTSGDPATMGAGRRNINIQTWADKCVWADESNIYCGVPQNLPEDAGLQRQQFNTLPDDVYHINLKTGVSEKISTEDQTHPITNPVLNRDQSKLIFSDSGSGKLYSYDLK